ncbi:MAG: hypothetical protein RR642_18285, partial [Solibacillus sp.]
EAAFDDETAVFIQHIRISTRTANDALHQHLFYTHAIFCGLSTQDEAAFDDETAVYILYMRISARIANDVLHPLKPQKKEAY